MRIRTYRDSSDLFAIGRLLRRANGRDPHCNAWSVARFDIWAQRRLAEERLQGECGWQSELRLWEDESGLQGAAFFPDSNTFRPSDGLTALALDPAHRNLAPEMLDWIEERHPAAGLPAGRLRQMEAKQGHPALGALLERRGFTRPADCMIQRKRLLQAQVDGAAPRRSLPEGFRIVPAAGEAGMEQFVRAVDGVFHMLDSLDTFQVVRQAPSAVPELDLMVLSPQGEAAAFCSLWLDIQNNLAEFEPVGTLPAFRKLGLGAALLDEACRRLAKSGVAVAAVESWSESPAANRLYESVELAEVDRIYGWEKRD